MRSVEITLNARKLNVFELLQVPTYGHKLGDIKLVSVVDSDDVDRTAESMTICANHPGGTLVYSNSEGNGKYNASIDRNDGSVLLSFTGSFKDYCIKLDVELLDGKDSRN